MLDYRTDQVWKETQRRQGEEEPLEPIHLMALCQNLAVLLYERMGYIVNRGHDFRGSQHPTEVVVWQMAKDAIEMCRLTPMDDVEVEYDEEVQ